MLLSTTKTGSTSRPSPRSDDDWSGKARGRDGRERRGTTRRAGAGADFQWPAVEGRRGFATGLINKYIARVIATAGRDAVIAERLLRVMHLLDAPQTLFAPSVLRRVLRTRSKALAVPPVQTSPQAREPRTEAALEGA